MEFIYHDGCLWQGFTYCQFVRLPHIYN
jgi:hypothetical protein